MAGPFLFKKKGVLMENEEDLLERIAIYLAEQVIIQQTCWNY